MDEHIKELESELAFYRNLFALCCALPGQVAAVDGPEEAPEADWKALWNTLDDIVDFVRTIEHSDQMIAAGVTCYELHTAPITPSA